MSKKRVLWLMNYTSLRNFEVPLLLKAGYEVFTPKIVPFGFGNENASVTWEYDQTLTISSENLELFNQTDFYHTIPTQIWELVNQSFDFIFLDLYPNLLKAVVENFRGVIILRSSVLSGKETCGEKIVQTLGTGFLSKLNSVGKRFWFAPIIQQINKFECRVLQSRYINMPFLQESAPMRKPQRTLSSFFCIACPQIRVRTSAGETYTDIQKIFDHDQYHIGGVQYVSIPNDSKVLSMSVDHGHIDHLEDYFSLYLSDVQADVFDPYGYDAISLGIPVIYLEGSAFDLMVNGQKKSGKKILPGRCSNHTQARKLLLKLRRNNSYWYSFIEQQQKMLLSYQSEEKMRTIWQTSMMHIESICHTSYYYEKNEPVKIAVILPKVCTENVIGYAECLIKCIQLGAKNLGDHIEVILGIVSGIKKAGIPIRKFTWTEKDSRWAIEAAKLKGIPCPHSFDNRYFILNDGNTNFEDCSYILFAMDYCPGALFTTKPYAVAVHDFAQRYVPDIISISDELSQYMLQRGADTVFVTNPSDYNDAVQYGGNRRENVIAIPFLFEAPTNNSSYFQLANQYHTEYFLWKTDDSPEKNNLRALNSILEYYSHGGSLKCFITGENTRYFDPRTKSENRSSDAEKIAKFIQNNNILRRNLVFLGKLDRNIYLSVLQKASFVFNPQITGDSTAHILDALYLHKPTIAGHYLSLKYADKYLNARIHFFDPYDCEAISDALLEAEKHYREYAAVLPTAADLDSLEVGAVYPEVYKHIKRIAII